MGIELQAPFGKFRVVGVDLFSHEDYLMGDYESRAEAFKVADKHNTKRSGSMDDIYYVYDHQGRYIRGNEAVGQKIFPRKIMKRSALSRHFRLFAAGGTWVGKPAAC